MTIALKISSDIDRATRELSGLQKKVIQPAARRAINDAVGKVDTASRKLVGKKLRLRKYNGVTPSARIRQAIRGQRLRRGRLDGAFIEATGKAIALGAFVGVKVTRRGVRHGGKLISRSFKQGIPRGAKKSLWRRINPYQRGASRKANRNVYKLTGGSVPSVLAEGKVKRHQQAVALDTWANRFPHHLKRNLKRI